MGEASWVIRKNGMFYRPNRSGYTSRIYEAGRYTEQEAKAEAGIEPKSMSAHPASKFEPPMTDNLTDLIERLDDLSVMLTGDDEERRIVERAASELRRLQNEVDKRVREFTYAHQQLCEQDNEIASLQSQLSEARELLEGFQRAKWKSVDKDNMEFDVCRVTCFTREKLNAFLSRTKEQPQPSQEKVDG